ncbi:MAG: dihydrodipicolinate synthase family protein [Rivularia sp. (in: cyanobacteria)]
MVSKTDLRQHARETMIGVENTIIPSFTPDLAQLDEQGIRHDVRQSIKHGFFSCLAATESGLSFAEAKEFVSIVCDEAGDQIKVTTTLLFDSWNQQFAMLEHAEKVGVDAVLLGYPTAWYPNTPEQIYEKSRNICESTNIGIILYPSPHFNYLRFHPSGFPIDVLHRLVDTCKNVIAVKLGEMGLIAECLHRFGDKVLIGCPIESYQPTCLLHLGLQWMGAGIYEVFQSPDKPYLVEYFNLLLQARRENDSNKAKHGMELYWRLTPARRTFESMYNPMLGTYHWTRQKFYQWCVGGNGGVTRQPSMKLHQHEMEQIRQSYRMIGIQPDGNDEAFYVGRSNYENK